jgi:hypothetical protein
LLAAFDEGQHSKWMLHPRNGRNHDGEVAARRPNWRYRFNAGVVRELCCAEPCLESFLVVVSELGDPTVTVAIAYLPDVRGHSTAQCLFNDERLGEMPVVGKGRWTTAGSCLNSGIRRFS